MSLWGPNVRLLMSPVGASCPEQEPHLGHWNWALQVPVGESAFSSYLRTTATTPPVLLAAPQNLYDSLTASILIKMAFGETASPSLVNVVILKWDF